jgi:signal peptidase I
MEPTLHCAEPEPGCLGRQVDLVYAVPYGGGEAPRRGDIVVFRTPPAAEIRCGAGGIFIKRVIGLPGERWRERGGKILIAGKTLDEPWLRPTWRDDEDFRGGPIPAGRNLLLGDNRASSCDSRIYGLIPRSSIEGQVVEIKRGSKRIHLR